MNRLQTPLALAIGAAIGVFAGSPPPIETVRELVLVDEEGRPRARLGMTGGQPVLIMIDEAGRRRAAFGILPEGNGASLALMDSSGSYPRVELRAEDPGNHGPVDFLTFRADELSESGLADTAVRLGHGGFGTGAELVLGAGADMLELTTFPFAGFSLRGREDRNGPAYWYQVGRLPRGERPNHPLIALGAGSKKAELEIAEDGIITRFVSGEETLERKYPE